MNSVERAVDRDVSTECSRLLQCRCGRRAQRKVADRVRVIPDLAWDLAREVNDG